MTLAWNGDDVARAMGTMFQKEERAKYIDLPLSNYSTWPNDKILKDGKIVGVSTFSGYSSNESSMLSLAIVDAEQSEPGTEVVARLGRGGRRLGEAGGRAARADRDPRDRLAGPVRRGRPRLVSATLDTWATSSLLGLYWTVSGPVEVHFGREWSHFDWADRCAEARKVGFSGLGIWHADLQHVLETRSLARDEAGLRRQRAAPCSSWSS